MKKFILTVALATTLGLSTDSIAKLVDPTLSKKEMGIQGFVKIEVNILPVNIRAMINKNNQGASIKDAFENKKSKLFKVILTFSNEQEKTVIYDQNGNEK